jgi:hypothetical protein
MQRKAAAAAAVHKRKYYKQRLPTQYLRQMQNLSSRNVTSRNATQTAKLVNLNIKWKKTTKKKQIIGFLYSTRSEILRNISTKTEEEGAQDRNKQS